MAEEVKQLVADLAVQFYDLGWFPGSGGSLTIRKGQIRPCLTCVHIGTRFSRSTKLLPAIKTGSEGSFFKRIFAPMGKVGAHASVGFGSVCA
jgi:ribulose-5-phosphate 4-epimerase/fuculose-1-phosphate aldolase